MRRSLLVLILSVICLVADPAPADAWFWRWIDDLSGPQFQGLSVDIKVWCSSQSRKARIDTLGQVRSRLEAEQRIYRRAALVATDNRALYPWAAMFWMAEAVETIDNGIYVNQLEWLFGDRVDYRDYTDSAVELALRYRDLAAASMSATATSQVIPRRNEELEHWLDVLDRSSATSSPSEPDVRRRARTLVRQFRNGMEVGKLAAEQTDLVAGVETLALATATTGYLNLHVSAMSGPVIPLGVSASACEFSYYDIDRFFVYASAGYGWDVKPENRGRDLKMVSVGGSFHWVIVPPITVGGGGGVTTFLTNSQYGAFPKFYFQAPIVDLKPLTLFLWNPRFRSPWAHTLYLRYAGVIFPGGFGPDRFYAGSPAYDDTEYIHSVGLFFDAEPLFRRWRGKWWKDKP